MGERRLARLGTRFPLKVERVFTEIHPDTPPQGSPISSLGYPPERWARMMDSLARMASAIGVTGIPTFVVGGKFVLEGAVPLELLIHAANEALAVP